MAEPLFEFWPPLRGSGDPPRPGSCVSCIEAGSGGVASAFALCIPCWVLFCFDMDCRCWPDREFDGCCGGLFLPPPNQFCRKEWVFLLLSTNLNRAGGTT